MWTVLGLVLPALMLMFSGGASAVEPRRPGQESFLTRAVFADGRLWLLSDAGELSSITEGRDTRVEESLPEPAIDLCLQNNDLVVITCEREGCPNWTVRRWVSGRWSVEAVVQRERDDLVALACSSRQMVLLTTRRLIDRTGGSQSAVLLSESLRASSVASVHMTPHQAFLGVNAGEWGGGLRRIERGSGKVTVIEHNATGDLCGGPRNTACDPVNGIASAPWRPDCIVAAIGLVHFVPHGRIVQVCGDKVERLYYKPYGEQAAGGPPRTGDEPFRTVAFFGLARADEAVWAAGIDGVYRIDSGGVAHMIPLPNFKSIGDIHVSFEIPHLILVLTRVNQRRSISGNVPLLVPR